MFKKPVKFISRKLMYTVIYSVFFLKRQLVIFAVNSIDLCCQWFITFIAFHNIHCYGWKPTINILGDICVFCQIWFSFQTADDLHFFFNHNVRYFSLNFTITWHTLGGVAKFIWKTPCVVRRFNR